jgi:hypothetical protein
VGPTGPAGSGGSGTGPQGDIGPQGYQGPAGSGGSGTGPTLGTIDVYFQGSTYLSKVVVNSAVSTTGTFTFAGPTNTTITITNIATGFSYPISAVCWGRDFTSSSNPTQSRYVGLFNQTACRLDYNTSGSGTITFTNASTTNLGVAATTNLPAAPTETLVARIFLTYF